MLVFNTNLHINLKDLINFAETKSFTKNITKEYLITMLLEDENVLSSVCEKTKNIGNSLKAAVIDDLSKLFQSLSTDPLKDYIPTLNNKPSFIEYGTSVQELVTSSSPEELLERLIIHYSTFGAGENSKYYAFRWDNELNGINEPDDIRLDQLFCLENQKKLLEDNTKLFLNGLPSDSVLLYGSRGSGKSSIVKALLNEYYSLGLRMIEIHKQHLKDLPNIIDTIKNKNFKYMLFLDDLSFENNDVEYKNLKIVIDGQIQRLPKNIRFYATSNRRHIINETWADRQGDDIHINDTMNEKLSLAERFGLSIYFPSPSQNEYFDIIKGILKQDSISISDDIKIKAIAWELSRGGRSGRTAAQFAKKIVTLQE